MMRRGVRLWVCSLFLSVLAAADVTGIWTGQIKGRNGETQDITFRFQQEGTSLTGKIYGDNEDTMLADGKVAGDEIRFTVTNEFGGGRGKYVYTGTVNGSTMQLTRDRESPRPGAGGDRRNSKQTFTLKRMT